MVAVIGRQRSGTTVFRRLLASSRRVYDVGEIFHAEYGQNRDNFFGFLEADVASGRLRIIDAFNTRSTARFLSYLREKYAPSIPMIDVKYNADFDPFIFQRTSSTDAGSPLLKVLQQAGASIFHIVRRNKLRLLVSEQIALTTAQWSIAHPDERQRAAIDLDVDTILSAIGQECDLSNRVTHHIQGSGRGVTLFYEDMFGPTGEFAPALLAMLDDRLGLRDLDPAPRLLRQNPDPLSALIGNYTAIEDALAGTAHAWMLAD